MTHRAAVLGKPIAHSLSPVIHNAGYAALGLTDWSYTAIECDEAELPGLVAGLGPEWAGLSLTMPLKEVALSVATTSSPLAATVGAANTLVRRPDGWYATNTDVDGHGRAAPPRLASAPAAPLHGARRRWHRPRRAWPRPRAWPPRTVTVVARRQSRSRSWRPRAAATWACR